MHTLTVWNTYDHFSDDYLQKHREVVLIDVMHQIIAYILQPSFSENDSLRQDIVLSLNLHHLSYLEGEKRNPENISITKTILNIPNDSYFRDHWNQSYPLWMIEKDLSEKENQNHFKIVDRLIWTLLRLGRTYESVLGERRASLNEATEIIVGSTPASIKPEHLCGEKAYTSYFKHYKSTCHFIAAFESMRKMDPSLTSLLEIKSVKQIEDFLNLSQKFRQELLSLQTPNIKNNTFFPEGALLPLPPYVKLKGKALSIQAFPAETLGTRLKGLRVNHS